MFVLSWRPHPASVGVFSRVLQIPGRAVSAFMQGAPAVTFWAYQQNIQEVFDAEGIPPWPALAVATIISRLHLGFPPEHPILERTGSFRRAFVVAGAPGNVIEETGLGGGGKRLRFGISDPRFIWHQEGTRFMPARPVVPDTSASKQLFCQKVESSLVALMDECVRRETG